MEILVDGLNRPECVTVDARGTLWAGGRNGEVYRIDPSTGAVEVISVIPHAYLLGVCADAVGNLLICDMQGHCVWCVDTVTGEARVILREVAGEPLVCPNFLAFSPDGSLWLSDSGEWSSQSGSGRLIRVAEDSGPTVAIRSMYFPNGLAVDESAAVYILESSRPGLLQLDPSRGETRMLASFPPHIVPDGLALCRTGDVLVLCYEPSVILRLNLGNGSIAPVTDGSGLQSPANGVFYGSKLEALAVANAEGTHISSLTGLGCGLPLYYGTPVLA